MLHQKPTIHKQSAAFVGLALLAGVCANPATAAMGNIATTYGLLPGDIASAQALSMFNAQASAVYYNPAYLAKDSRGELTSGILHADHDLRGKSVGGDAPLLNRKSDTILNKPSQHLVLGMKTNLSSLSKMEHPLYFGVMLGVEKYGSEMMAFSSETSPQGQYVEYGRQPLFMTFGFGTKVWRGIDVGLSLRTTLHAKAQLNASSELDGSTHHETMNISATPSMKAIVGVNFDWGDTFCIRDCWLNGFETAVSYRQASNTHAVVDSNIVIPGMIEAPGLNLNILTLDSYQPDITAVGFSYRGKRWQAAVVAEHQAWSRLEKELKKDTIGNPAMTADGNREAAKFKDIVIPRLGGQFNITEHFAVLGGVAYSETPVDSRSSMDMNFLDGDKIIVGVGLTAEYPKTRFLSFPVRFDVGYHYQNIRKTEFDLYSSAYKDGKESYETLEAGGDVHVVTGSMTLKF